MYCMMMSVCSRRLSLSQLGLLFIIALISLRLQPSLIRILFIGRDSYSAYSYKVAHTVTQREYWSHV